MPVLVVDVGVVWFEAGLLFPIGDGAIVETPSTLTTTHLRFKSTDIACRSLRT